MPRQAGKQGMQVGPSEEWIDDVIASEKSFQTEFDFRS
jgi:hypothetical protein